MFARISQSPNRLLSTVTIIFSPEISGVQTRLPYSINILYIQTMSRNNGSKLTSKDELCEELRDLVVEKQQVKEQIREVEKQIDRAQKNMNKAG